MTHANTPTTEADQSADVWALLADLVEEARRRTLPALRGLRVGADRHLFIEVGDTQAVEAWAAWMGAGIEREGDIRRTVQPWDRRWRSWSLHVWTRLPVEG